MTSRFSIAPELEIKRERSYRWYKCAICMSQPAKAFTNSKRVVECYKCRSWFHVRCYGAVWVTKSRIANDGLFQCQCCSGTLKFAYTCVLCGCGGGVVRRHRVKNEFYHLQCITWLRHLYFSSDDNRSYVEPIGPAPESHCNRVCCYCNQDGGTYLLKCEQDRCFTFFHITCVLADITNVLEVRYAIKLSTVWDRETTHVLKRRVRCVQCTRALPSRGYVIVEGQC